ncbi:amino acid adenylation domain-containing protein [Streptomyces sp. DvalAA-21]|nr:amino acid adenylation domain protein [Streptomyces sp. SirexAA-E]PZX31307.1 amino acid adenylation domain-containing protein [Streptomyces sp. DvalAA-21]RAJ27145.1 amino acid adenylation domain-containing protein [Streptomyces sp. DpondAA-E10]RAJ41493.1 amino acid adenylation domain-containing protein [Streptomyces sp. DpondAA-A50]SCE50422.1 amino acid adenylation domain-containing protein [Streptomyces sp. DpondAA-F4a]SCL84783.1 amino acid adenylation domain-containing protein [Streptomyc
MSDEAVVPARTAKGERSLHAPDAVREAVAHALEMAPHELDDDRDLFELGLDSLILMSLVGTWRRAGSTVTFQELTRTPTLDAWTALLAHERSVEAPTSPAPAGPATALQAPTDGEPAEPFPLATMQHAYWIGRQDGQPLGGVAAHFYVELDGHDVDPGRLDTALRALVLRHGMLRAVFDGEGRQRFGPPGTPLTVHDLRDRAPKDAENELELLRERNTHARPDIISGDVFRAALCLLPDGRTRLQIDLDMMAGDALSLRVLLSDLRRLYDCPDDQPPALGLDYRTYLAEHDARRRTERERHAAWWRERLPELPRAPRLPTTVDPLTPVSADDTTLTHSRRLHHWLGPADKAALIGAARRHGITPAAALATAFAEVIAAWSDSRRFLLNLPLFDREMFTPDVAGLVGDFSSSVLLDTDMSQSLPFSRQARGLQERLQEGISHGAYGGVEVLRDLARAEGAPVLAPVVYTSAIGLGEIFEQDVQKSFGRPSWIISQGPQVHLDAQVTELDGGLLLNWDVRDGVFEARVPDAAFDAYRGLITRLITDPDTWARPVDGLLAPDVLPGRAVAALPPTPVPDRALHTRFFQLAETDPRRVAVVRTGGDTLTYGELADSARRIAALLRGHGVREGDTVALTLPRSADQITAVLGILAAGAAYAPVGVEQPAVRRGRIHSMAGASAVLTDREHAPLCQTVSAAPVLLLEDARTHEPAPVVRPDPALPAYVLFTSGSTGLPKGVEVSHRAVVNTVEAMEAQLGLGPADRALAISALDFDLATWDIFAPLSLGGQVVTVGQEHRRDAHHWAHLVRTHGVTLVQCVPALLDLLLAAGEDEGLGDCLRMVLLGGDWVGLDQPRRLRALVPGCRFVALGGMTEAAVHSTVFEVEETDPAWKSVPYGVPLRNMRARVVDGRGRDCPDLVPGELWIGGPGVANGYRADPERTAERFVEYDGERWYRSGDLARYRPDGVLEFLGRADHQVKIGGHRIELGEVESALEDDPAVLHAVACVLDTPARHLAAAVSAAGEAPDPDRVRLRAAQRLPAYMVPERLLVLRNLPLTANGKLDRAAVRRALTEAAGDDGPRASAPVGPVETAVAAEWAELLDVPEVGRESSFFLLGGDSLVATRMIGRLRAAGFSGARVADLFAHPVLRHFCGTLRPRAATDAQPVPATAPVLVPDPDRAHEPFPLTDVQSAYHTGRDPRFTLGGVGTWHYTEFDGADVDLDRLEHAWNTLIRRHGMLRAVVEDGHQRVLPDTPPFRIPVADVPDGDAPEALAGLRARLSQQVRDPARWPLFAVEAVRYHDGGAARTRIGIGLDYLVLDALSITTLYAELNALHADPEHELPPVDVSFRDYLTGLPTDPESAEPARAHWRKRLSELPPPPALPLDRDPATLDVPAFTRRRLSLPAEDWQAVKREAARHGLTPSTVLLALYAEVLEAWSGTDALTVTLTLFNRRDVHPHIHRVLGDFTSLSPAGHRRDGASWLAAAEALQRRQAEDLDHLNVPIDWLLREFGRRTGTVDAAAPVVFTSAVGVGDATLAGPGSGFPAKVWGISQSPQVCLDNQVTEESGNLVVTWDAVEELFPEGVLDAMFGAYERLLGYVVAGDWDAPLPDLLPASHMERRAAVAREAALEPVAPRPLHAAFFAHAEAVPDRTALVTAAGEKVTYGVLADQALRTAAALGDAGVTPGELVAVTLPKGPEQVAAVLGVLAAGAAYVPLSLEQPAARLERVHATAAFQVVVGHWPAPGGTAPRALSVTDTQALDPLPAPSETSTEALAYVIFTSGSTGEPKGVEITHAAAWNTIADINARHGIGDDDRVFALSSLDFDLSVYDIFGMLGAGGSLLLPTEDQRREPARWPSLLDRHGVTVWNTVPALLDLLLDADEQEAPEGGRIAGLRTALVSGDWIGLDLPGRLRARTARPCAFVAMGGATEAAIWSNTLTVEEPDPGWVSIPYGRPLTGQHYRVVDRDGRDCPDWTPGELWIGGAGLARGYLADPVRTAEKFVRRDGQRWYRTGDLGRFRGDGLLEFMGRLDSQLKIAGHRVEAGEIEAALESHPAVARAAVVAVGERTAKRLAAFVVPHERTSTESVGPTVRDTEDLTRSLFALLAERVPVYAVPARIQTLPSLPLTANGKVDRGALAALTGPETVSAVAEPPHGETETALAGLWSEHLPHWTPDRNANFFTAGGDSLTALRLLTAMERRLGATVPARRFFAAPTIAALAADITRTPAAHGTAYETGEL